MYTMLTRNGDALLIETLLGALLEWYDFPSFLNRAAPDLYAFTRSHRLVANISWHILEPGIVLDSRRVIVHYLYTTVLMVVTCWLSFGRPNLTLG